MAENNLPTETPAQTPSPTVVDKAATNLFASAPFWMATSAILVLLLATVVYANYSQSPKKNGPTPTPTATTSPSATASLTPTATSTPKPDEKSVIIVFKF